MGYLIYAGVVIAVELQYFTLRRICINYVITMALLSNDAKKVLLIKINILCHIKFFITFTFPPPSERALLGEFEFSH